LYGKYLGRDTLLHLQAIKQSGVIETPELFATAQSVLLVGAVNRLLSRRSINNNTSAPQLNKNPTDSRAVLAWQSSKKH
jgi:hypothetical protein